MIVFSDKEHFTGGKGRFVVRKLTADTIEEWFRLLAAAVALDKPDQWWAEAPSAAEPWRANLKRQVVVWCRAGCMPELVVQSGAVQVPEAYWQLCGGLLRQDMWKAWRTDEWSDDTLWEFWRRKVKWLAGQVFRTGSYVANPVAWDGGEAVGGVRFSEQGAVEAVKTWNAWIENFDLAQHRRVNPASYGKKKPEITLDDSKWVVTRSMDLEEDQLAYVSMSPEQKQEMLQAKPWLLGMWKKWDLLWEGGTIFIGTRKVLWLSPKEEEAPQEHETE